MDVVENGFPKLEGKEILMIFDGANISGIILGEIFNHRQSSKTIDYATFPTEIIKKSELILEEGNKNLEIFYVDKTRRGEQKARFFIALEKRNIKLILPKEDMPAGDDWDDRQIIKLLERASENPDIKYVFLVSHNGGFIEVLRKNKLAGKEVYCVGTEKMMNREMQSSFAFIDVLSIPLENIEYKQLELPLFEEKIDEGTNNIEIRVVLDSKNMSNCKEIFSTMFCALEKLEKKGIHGQVHLMQKGKIVFKND